MIEKILKIIFPVSCGICGKINSKWICPKCYIKIKKELKFYTVTEKDYKLYFIGFYENLLRKLLLKFKFNDSAYLANIFVELLYKDIAFKEKIEEYDCVIPVPMYYRNKNIRGYNQTELLAEKISELLKIEYLNNVLIKRFQNQRQSELGEKNRIENVKNVYFLKDEELIKQKNILLIDDIYTTGSTIRECIKTLKKADIKNIDVLVIAKRN